MPGITSNTNYLVLYSSEIKIFSLPLLSPVKAPSARPSLLVLAANTIFYSTEKGVESYNIISGKSTIAVPASEKSEVTALTASAGVLHVGYVNGRIETYIFNEHMFKFSTKLKHPTGVDSLETNGMEIFVTDGINRITVYPGGSSYDFTTPKLFKGGINGRVYALSEGKLYLSTKEGFGFLFKVGEETEEIVFSPLGGFIFGSNGRDVSVYNILGNEMGCFIAKDFTVINKGGRCFIIEDKGDGRFKKINTELEDNETPELDLFKGTNIITKRVSGEEYDNKESDYVGRSTYLNKEDVMKYVKGSNGITDNNKENNITDNNKENNINNINNINKENNINNVNKRHRHMVVDPDNFTHETTKLDKTNLESIIQQIGRQNPSSHHNSDARLLFLSPQGFMISIETPLISKVYIQYHSTNMDRLDIKDNLRATLGSFHGSNFVLSDGKTVNFSGLWQRNMPCSLLGLDNNFIYTFDDDLVRITDFNGNIIKTIYAPEAHSFCLGTGRLAVLCKTCIMIYQGTEAEYIPAFGVDFGCYEDENLYVRIKNRVFEVKNKILEFLIECIEKPLTVSLGFLVTLTTDQDILLPRPRVNYYKLKEEKVKEVEVDRRYFKSYDVI